MRRLATVLLLALSALLMPAAPAHADAAEAQGWWWVGHRAGLPAPPAPPDVGETDLLLQGGDAERVAQPGTEPAPMALAALRFAVPVGAEAGALVLKVGTGARAADVRAYPAAGPWSPAQGGAIEDAPTPDLSRFAPGFLSEDGASLSFPEAGSLTGDDGVLSLVLVAGPTDRVVLHKPDATALAVTPVPVTTPQPPYPTPSGAVAPPAPAPQPVALPPVSVPVAPSGVAPAPSVATAAPAANAPVALRREVADDARTRVVVALEALLLLVFFGLLGHGPAAVLGRRLGSVPVASPERGVGRFRRTREGRPPRL